MKMIIDIPDNELKDPLKNIHLLISNGIVTEVCIRKYDKDEPYFMNLNYAPLEECEDAISREDALMALTGEWKESRDEILPKAIRRIKALPPVKPAEKVGHWITVDKGLMVTSYKCSECGRIERDDTGYDVTKDYPYCHCGAKMQEERE